MRKVNVDLRNVNIPEFGISVYTNELVRRLMDCNDIELRGTAFRRKLFQPLDPEDYRRFRFPIHFSRVPAWMMFRLLPFRRFLPDYNFWAGDNESDVFLFFWFQAPLLPVKGKIVTCVHDIIPLRGASGDARYFKRATENVIEKSARIITVSEFSKRDIMDYFHISGEQIDVVYCGVNAEAFQQSFDREAVRAKYNLPEKYILYFGTCTRRKNVESAVRAYARLPETVRKEYALVITNPLEAIKTCAAENNVTPCYVDGVSLEDKPAVYQMASVLVWPSLYEGFGIPIIEAQAAGTPVVCSNVTSLPEVAGDAAVLVEPMDTESMAAGIERCLYDAPFRQDLIAKGHENVKRFSWDESAKKLHDIIINL